MLLCIRGYSLPGGGVYGNKVSIWFPRTKNTVKNDHLYAHCDVWTVIDFYELLPVEYTKRVQRDAVVFHINSSLTPTMYTIVLSLVTYECVIPRDTYHKYVEHEYTHFKRYWR